MKRVVVTAGGKFPDQGMPAASAELVQFVAETSRDAILLTRLAAIVGEEFAYRDLLILVDRYGPHDYPPSRGDHGQVR